MYNYYTFNSISLISLQLFALFALFALSLYSFMTLNSILGGTGMKDFLNPSYIGLIGLIILIGLRL